MLYYKQDRYSEAEPLNKRSLAIREKALGPDHPAVGTSLNNLAALYFKQGRYADAEPLFRRSLAIWERALRPHHPNIANSLNHLTELYWSQGRYADALPLVQELVASGRAVPASVLPALLGGERNKLISTETALDDSLKCYRPATPRLETSPALRRSQALRARSFMPGGARSWSRTGK